MRVVGVILLILVAVGWLIVELPLAPSPDSLDSDDGWRRTRHGWQRMDQWPSAYRSQRPLLHPMVVGLLECLLTLSALLAFSKPIASPETRR